MRVMNLNKLIFLQLRGPEGKKIPKAISDFGVDNSKYTIISLRTFQTQRLACLQGFCVYLLLVCCVRRTIHYYSSKVSI